MVSFFGLNYMCVATAASLLFLSYRLNLEGLSLSGSFTKFLMYSKNTFLAERDQSSPAKRLRKNISDLYLAGGVSAQRAASLFEDSVAAGASNTEDLAVPVSKNSQRDLRRKLLKNSKWPPLYEIEVPVLHQKTHAETLEKVVVLLPHEILFAIHLWNQDIASLFQISGMSELQQRSFLTKTAELRLEASTTMPLGLWADGCPVKWDRSESIVVISLNFPGQTLDKYKRLRIPLCVPGLYN